MMKRNRFIRVTDAAGLAYLINPEHVAMVCSNAENGRTVIVFANRLTAEGALVVCESLDDIQAMLEGLESLDETQAMLEGLEGLDDGLGWQ